MNLFIVSILICKFFYHSFKFYGSYNLFFHLVDFLKKSTNLLQFASLILSMFYESSNLFLFYLNFLNLSYNFIFSSCLSFLNSTTSYNLFILFCLNLLKFRLSNNLIFSFCLNFLNLAQPSKTLIFYFVLTL
jgi:hypothetical protein